MKLIEKQNVKFAVVYNVNLDRATMNEAIKFKEYLAEDVKNSNKDIIVNLSACEHLDSTFLGALVSTYKTLKKQNRIVALIEPENQSSILLTLNSIGKIFPLYKSIKVALDDIENKKLIESELNGLADEQADVADSLQPIASESEIETVSIKPVVEYQELNVEESKSEFEKFDSTQEILEEAEDNPLEMEETTNNSLDNNEIEFENDTEQTSESEVVVASSLNEEEIEESLEYEGSHSDQGNIKWEFGFSS